MISGYCFAILVVPSPIFGITIVVVGYLIIATIGKHYDFGPGVNYTYFGIVSVCILNYIFFVLFAVLFSWAFKHILMDPHFGSLGFAFALAINGTFLWKDE